MDAKGAASSDRNSRFKVIIPAIIKDIVEDQELPVRGGALNFTEPTRLHMSMDTSLDTPLGVKIDPLPLGLYRPPAVPDADNKDHAKAFLTLQMPEQHIHHETEVKIPDQIVDITDQTDLVAWFNDFFDKDFAQLRVKTDDLSAHLGALHYTVNLDKTVRVPGLRYLKGFGVQDMQFMIPPDSAGRNMKGHLVIPNAGVLTLGLGNVTFNVVAGDITLGLVNIYNLDLKPGNNTPPFDGVFYFDQLIPNLAALLDTQQGALAEGMLEFNATGNSTFHNGQRVAYIEGVLNHKRIPFRIPATTLLLDVVGALLGGAAGANGAQLPLLDTLGDVMGNKTLLEQMLSHFDSAPGDNGGGNGGVKAKKSNTEKLGKSLKMNLFKLGLRSLAKM